VKAGGRTNLLILSAVVALAGAPLALGVAQGQDEPFAGTDARAQAVVAETEPGYRPWFSPVFSPPSAEVESGLFALQAALGAGAVGYCLGVVRTRRRVSAEQAGAARPVPPDGPAGPTEGRAG